MTPPAYLTLVEDKERRAKEASLVVRGGGEPPGGDLSRRVEALEKSHEEISGALSKLLERTYVADGKLTSMDTKLDTKASAIDLAKISGRVDSLPTTWQMITLVIGTVGTILGGAFLILKFGLPHTP